MILYFDFIFSVLLILPAIDYFYPFTNYFYPFTNYFHSEVSNCSLYFKSKNENLTFNSLIIDIIILLSIIFKNSIHV